MLERNNYANHMNIFILCSYESYCVHMNDMYKKLAAIHWLWVIFLVTFSCMWIPRWSPSMAPVLGKTWVLSWVGYPQFSCIYRWHFPNQPFLDTPISHRIHICHIYMVTFTINIPQMLPYIPYMDPMGYGNSHIPYIYYIYIFNLVNCASTWLMTWRPSCRPQRGPVQPTTSASRFSFGAF